MEIELPSSPRTAILFGHADADGHLAAEQSRDWLARRGIDVTTVVSPQTWDYRFWKRLTKIDLSNYELVVCVDIAFRFRSPSESLDDLLSVADRHPQKLFVVIDHHPLVQPQEPRRNLKLISVTDPYDCCLGVPSPELMQVAALCDGALTAVTPTPLLEKRVLGVKRAAADVNGVAGKILLELIRERRWEFFEALSEEDKEIHRSVRGRRRSNNNVSPLLECARLQSS